MYLILFSILFSSISFSHASSFENWKKQYIKRASKRGLPSSFLNKIMSQVHFNAEVIEKDKNQITSNTDIDYQKWIPTWLRENPSRIEQGIEMLKKHKALLEKVEKKYQVDKEIIVSLWGVETLYGNITGEYDLLNSLATLAYDGRRRRFFEIQLNASLKLIEKGHVTRENLKGSWAGATGQCQFMPSNINGYAVDFDGDGKKDIWTNEADLFASIANLLKKAGWKKGREVGTLIMSSEDKKIKLNKYRTAMQYNQLGFKKIDGSPVQGNWRRRAEDIPFKNSPLVLRGSNYAPLMKWNKSSLFAALNILLFEALKKENL